MENPTPIELLLQKDPRYPIEAYQFLRDALSYASEELGYGGRGRIDPAEPLENEEVKENHLTGQELCEAIRQYAINQYGLMAISVLNSWNIFTTDDFGEIVYHMIEIGLMKKSEEDKQEHFNQVYDFKSVFVDQFEIER